MYSSLRLWSLPALGLILASLGAPVAAADYENKLTNVYHAQENAVWCGAATAQMVLDATNLGNIIKSQSSLYTTIQANNGPVSTAGTANGNYYTTPDGLRATLQLSDTNAGHSYIAYNLASYDQSIKILAYDIDHYGITAGALINKGAHWINVYGVATNVKPVTTGAFTINGFYIKDPWTGYSPGNGLGKTAYIRNDADGWKKYFTPTNYGGKYQGKYAFVADPDPGEDTLPADPPVGTTPVNDAATALSQAAFDLGQLTDLSNDLSFENGTFGSLGEQLITLASGSQEWLVPYDQTGSGATSGVALIDPVTGDLDYALWDEGVLSGDSLTNLTAHLQSDGLPFDNVVPEPSTLLLLTVGAAAAFAVRRRVSRLGHSCPGISFPA
jgi:hypothetical protein